MELEHSFIIPVPPEQAWPVLLDVERVAPCMPGATVDSVDGEVIKGRIKVKVGPVALTYAGTARFTERDEQARSITLEASGKETRGAGTASATVRSSLEDEGGQTKVVVITTMNVTGQAQFGRGVMAEVSGRIIEKFAANLAALLASAPAAGVAASNGSGRRRTPPAPGRPGVPLTVPRIRPRWRNSSYPGVPTTACGGWASTRWMTCPPVPRPICSPSRTSARSRCGRSRTDWPASAATWRSSRRARRPRSRSRRGAYRRGRRRTCRGASPGGARPGPGGRVPGCPAARRGRHRPAQRGRLPGAEAGTAGARRGGRPATGDLRPAARPPQGLTARLPSAGGRPLAAAAGRWPPSAVRQRSETLPPVQGRALSIPGPAVRRLQ